MGYVCFLPEYRLSTEALYPAAVYDLKAAIQKGFEALDGFYTFLMGTADKLALVRDAFACKPAVVAETDDYVAIASEFRSLAHLPHINHAHIYEPAPEEMYVWTV